LQRFKDDPERKKLFLPDYSSVVSYWGGVRGREEKIHLGGLRGHTKKKTPDRLRAITKLKLSL